MNIKPVDLIDAAELLQGIIMDEVDTYLRKPLVAFGGLFLEVPALAEAGQYMLDFAHGSINDAEPARRHLATIEQFQA